MMLSTQHLQRQYGKEGITSWQLCTNNYKIQIFMRQDFDHLIHEVWIEFVSNVWCSEKKIFKNSAASTRTHSSRVVLDGSTHLLVRKTKGLAMVDGAGDDISSPTVSVSPVFTPNRNPTYCVQISQIWNLLQHVYVPWWNQLWFYQWSPEYLPAPRCCDQLWQVMIVGGLFSGMGGPRILGRRLHSHVLVSLDFSRQSVLSNKAFVCAPLFFDIYCCPESCHSSSQESWHSMLCFICVH